MGSTCELVYMIVKVSCKIAGRVFFRDGKFLAFVVHDIKVKNIVQPNLKTSYQSKLKVQEVFFLLLPRHMIAQNLTF